MVFVENQNQYSDSVRINILILLIMLIMVVYRNIIFTLQKIKYLYLCVINVIILYKYAFVVCSNTFILKIFLIFLILHGINKNLSLIDELFLLMTFSANNNISFFVNFFHISPSFQCHLSFFGDLSNPWPYHLRRDLLIYTTIVTTASSKIRCALTRVLFSSVTQPNNAFN